MEDLTLYVLCVWRWSARRVLLSYALGVLVAATAHAGDGMRLPSAGAGVIPDAHGAVAEILLHYVPDLAEELEPLYEGLFRELPLDVRLKVLCPTAKDTHEFADKCGPAMWGRHVNVGNVGVHISVWARDRCIARQPLSLRGVGPTFVPSTGSHASILHAAVVNGYDNDEEAR
ncbi:MAG: hypothetical protein ACYTFA_01920 [Planctomycetota bacterium]|jgi:hypothetical protein